MDRIGSKKKINTLIRWVFEVLFLFLSLVMFSSSFIAGLFFLLAAVVSIPPAAAELEKKLNISIPGIAQFFIVFFLVAVAISAMPHTPVAVNNSTTTIAAPPSTVNNNEAIAVPSEPAQVATPTPTPTPPPIPDSKGTLDIVTNPTGATVTIDGVSQGTTPVSGLSIDAGTHAVSLYLAGYDLHKETVNLANSETKSILWDFVPDTSQNPTPSTPEVTPTETSTPETTPTETPTPETTQKPLPVQIIAKWTGSGIKNTETFHVTSNEWFIAWDTRPGQYGNMNFIVTVYNSDGSYKDSAANVIGASNDHTVERGAGDYYLNINTAQPYTIEIQE